MVKDMHNKESILPGSGPLGAIPAGGIRTDSAVPTTARGRARVDSAGRPSGVLLRLQPTLVRSGHATGRFPGRFDGLQQPLSVGIFSRLPVEITAITISTAYINRRTCCDLYNTL